MWVIKRTPSYAPYLGPLGTWHARPTSARAYDTREEAEASAPTLVALRGHRWKVVDLAGEMLEHALERQALAARARR